MYYQDAVLKELKNINSIPLSYSDSKGLKISYRKDGEDKEMLLKWEDVERRIKTLIDENLYIR